MQVLEWIIKISGAITAIIGIWRVIVLFVRKIDNLGEDIKEIKEHNLENYLGIKRLTVMSHDMPIGERIIAGNDYIKAGGNGEVKKYIEKELHTKEIQHD